ncbi:hypothetical protein K503DRAFT_161094 [Rhizopogon vinicolor AM-OR11-026]|uniref:Uncharacterized protein n=1 Tax=Rhizopogon vinicolor AM-OR11-026 TaxID=1314800 RepID=A0A1B7ME06_9AGAM|nr:hypothetical protein K503DRAFT_161094 [Rhizopogon vinicolor AM-OR11-026]
MPVLLPPQPQRQRLDHLSSTIPDHFISTYSFNSCHSLNPFFHYHSSIRNLPPFTDRTPSPLPLSIPGRPVFSFQYKSCTVLIDHRIIIRAPVILHRTSNALTII